MELIVTVNGSDQTVYNGPAGNYAVLNYDTDSSYGFKTLTASACFPPLATVFCFILGTGLDGSGSAGQNKLLVSRTSLTTVDGTTTDLYELPALYLGGVNVVGDVYSPDASNFAFWGRNLAQNPGGTVSPGAGASWALGSAYINNPQAQSQWNSDQTNTFINEKLPVLEGEATPFDIGNYNIPSVLALDYQDITMNVNRQDSQYPEGKIWKLDAPGLNNNLTLSQSSKTYFGKGTIIVPGDLTIASGIDVLPNNDSDRLGFIVLGDVIIEGNNNIKAAILSLGLNGIEVGNNVQLTGSFVAQSFNITGNNVSFFYDYAFDKDWPPGFRDLEMPHVAPGT